jgi:hypothetical protein
MTAGASRADSWLLDLIMFRLLCGSTAKRAMQFFFPSDDKVQPIAALVIFVNVSYENTNKNT